MSKFCPIEKEKDLDFVASSQRYKELPVDLVTLFTFSPIIRIPEIGLYQQIYRLHIYRHIIGTQSLSFSSFLVEFTT